MSRRRTLRLSSLILLGLLMLLAWPNGAWSRALQVSPAAVHIGLLFKGARLTVSADVPEQAQAVIEVTGEAGKEELMRKGRHWDLWMNVEEIDVFGVPYVYHVMSSSAGIDLRDDGRQPWGYAGLFQNARFGKDDIDHAPSELFREFVALKESKGLYQASAQALELLPPVNHRRLVKGVFQFPSRLPAGRYQVRLWALVNGKIVEQQKTRFDVSLSGLPALIFRLASLRPGLYGVLSAIVAGAAGLICALAFSLKRPAPPHGGGTDRR